MDRLDAKHPPPASALPPERAFAAVLEMTFTQPWEAELRAEAEELAAWLRATTAR